MKEMEDEQGSTIEDICSGLFRRAGLEQHSTHLKLWMVCEVRYDEPLWKYSSRMWTQKTIIRKPPCKPRPSAWGQEEDPKKRGGKNWKFWRFTQKWYTMNGTNQYLIHPMNPVLRMIKGHPIAINADTHAKLIFTLCTSFGLNFFKSKCHTSLLWTWLTLGSTNMYKCSLEDDFRT